MARQYCSTSAHKIGLLAVDAEGCHLQVDSTIHYVPFPQPCLTLEAVRAAMIQLAGAAS